MSALRAACRPSVIEAMSDRTIGFLAAFVGVAGSILGTVLL